jgi:hypothetical protein
MLNKQGLVFMKNLNLKTSNMKKGRKLPEMRPKRKTEGARRYGT